MRMCACRGTAGFAHVSCLAEQAKILMDEAEENNLDGERRRARWDRWHTCSLCEQRHHGVVLCALGWACWKTYMGRPEEDWAQLKGPAMTLLGNGLSDAKQDKDALSVREAQLSMYRRLGAPDENILDVQGNLSNTYAMLGRDEEANRMVRDVYAGRLRLSGEEAKDTLISASNYAISLLTLERLEEARTLLRKSISVARRVLGGNDDLTLRMRFNYARALYFDAGATLDDLREAVAMLAEMTPIARRVFGAVHPSTAAHELALRQARAALRARETPSDSKT